MHAQPIETYGQTPWRAEPARQRRSDHTLEDLLNLPPDAPRVELSHGVMLVTPSPIASHQTIASRLWSWLDQHAPEHYWAAQGLGVAVALNRTFEPDVLLLNAGDDSRHFYQPREVTLVVEVVSPNTRARDRMIKPAEYAAAGIPFYWRVEQNPLRIYAYRLTGGAYTLVADSADVLTLSEPFAITLPIPDLTRRRPAPPTPARTDTGPTRDPAEDDPDPIMERGSGIPPGLL